MYFVIASVNLSLNFSGLNLWYIIGIRIVSDSYFLWKIQNCYVLFHLDLLYHKQHQNNLNDKLLSYFIYQYSTWYYCVDKICRIYNYSFIYLFIIILRSLFYRYRNFIVVWQQTLPRRMSTLQFVWNEPNRPEPETGQKVQESHTLWSAFRRRRPDGVFGFHATIT